MKIVLMIASMAEAGTGIVLLAYPPIVVRLLFGAETDSAGVVMCRIAGISLVSLGIACWPDNTPYAGVYGMFTYSFLAMLYLIYLGIGGEWTGILLWPGVVIHAGLGALLARAWVQRQKTLDSREKTISPNPK